MSTTASVVADAVANITYPPATLPVLVSASKYDSASASWSEIWRHAFRRSIVGKLFKVLSEAIDNSETMAEGASVGSEAAAAAGATGAEAAGRQTFIQSSDQGFGSVFAYMASPWAIMCIFMTIVLNRTTLYASLRRPIRLPFRLRLLLRALPLFLLFLQIQDIVQALRCQTSPHVDVESRIEAGGFLYWVARVLSLWETDDKKVCVAAGLASPSMLGMGPDPKDWVLRGSLDILWPLYTTLATSQFIETLSCALSGRPPAAETVMTFFETSVAFAQAEAMSHLNPFVDRKNRNTAGPMPRDVSAEVLYIALITANGHFTSQLLGLWGKQAKYRLYATGFWGSAILAGFAWALYGAWTGGVAVMRMRRFPTVCVVGFIPHLVIVMGIFTCISIYALAFVFSSLSPSSGSRRHRNSWTRPSLVLGFQNLQANVTLSSIHLNPSEDFYTSLLKIGFVVLTAASEATYLNEGRPIRVPGLTWLEVERLRLLEKEKSWHGDQAGDGGSLVRAEDRDSGKSPYAVERNGFSKDMAQNNKTKGRGGRNSRTTGSSQWRAAAEIVRGTFVVATRWGVFNILRIFRNEEVVEGIEGESAGEAFEEIDKVGSSVFHGATMQAGGLPLDAEAVGDEDEASKLYKRFLSGNLPEYDSDSDYIPDDEPSDIDNDDDDVSIGTPQPNFDDDENESVYQQDTALSLRSTRESSPFPTLLSSPESLASLLDPKTPSQRQAAKLLAHHLTSSSPVTRQQFQHRQTQDNRLLYRGILSRLKPTQSDSTSEEAILESVILERRSQAISRPRQGTPVPDAAEGEGSEGMGPLCVVCQSAPRTILVWPCRCLALCEDCRVSLAVNNFGTCVCCRGELAGFSRIYIP